MQSTEFDPVPATEAVQPAPEVEAPPIELAPAPAEESVTTQPEEEPARYSKDELVHRDAAARLTQEMGIPITPWDIAGALHQAGATDASVSELIDHVRAFRDREV